MLSYLFLFSGHLIYLTLYLTLLPEACEQVVTREHRLAKA
jgi:hypothetical protein